MMVYLINFFSFSSFFFFGLGISLLLQPRPQLLWLFPSLGRQATGNNPGRKKALFSVLKILNPVNRPLSKLFGRTKWDNQLQTVKIELTPEEFLAIKEILLVGICVILYFVFGHLKIYWFILAGVLGFMVPDLILQASVKKRRRLITKTLPEVLDMLTLSIEAGLDFMLALKMIIEQSKPSPFIEEIAVLYREIQVGKPRRQALQDMSKKLDIPEVSSFARALIQAERMGTSISDILKMISEETSRIRFQRAERIALSAPIKMLIPLIFFILPTVGIIVGGPIILQFIKGGIQF